MSGGYFPLDKGELEWVKKIMKIKKSRAAAIMLWLLKTGWVKKSQEINDVPVIQQD